MNSEEKWIVRERRDQSGNLRDCFVEAPKTEGMAYGLEVLGDDYTGYGDQEGKLEHCRRIVACVNACAGVPLEWLAGGTVGCVQGLREDRDTWQQHYRFVEQQRDELRAALESAVEAIRLFRNERQLAQLISLRATAGYVAMDAAMDRGNAAIAKATQS